MKKYILIFLGSLVLSLLLALLRGGYVPPVLGLDGIYLCAFIGFIIVCSLTYIVLKKCSGSSRPVMILLTIILGLSIIELPIRILNFESSLFTLGTFLMWWFGAVIGYLIFKVRKLYAKILIAAVSLAFAVWFSYSCYPLWFNRIAYGKIEENSYPAITFQKDANETIRLSDMRGKYVVLDFWRSSCGVCFKKFPDVQKLYDKYKNSEGILVYAVFCILEEHEETHETGSGILFENGYTFPSLSINNNAPILKEIGVNGVPTVIIIDPDGRMVFRGTIESAAMYLEKIKTL